MRVLRSQYLQLQQGEGLAGSSCLENTAPCQQILRTQCLKLQQKVDDSGTDQNEKVIKPMPKKCSTASQTNTTAKNTTNASHSNVEINSQSTISRRISHGSSSTSYSITSQEEHENNGDYYETTSYSEYRNISITLRNIPENIKVKVHVHPVDMDNVWLSRVYRSYENDLWHKSPREPQSRKKKWYYNCLLCHKPLMAFETLKYHLNRHLELYPFVCKVCGRPHTSRNKAVKHLTKAHCIVKDYKCFIGN